MHFSGRVPDLDRRRLLFLIIPTLSLFLLLSLPSLFINPFSSLAPLRGFLISHASQNLENNAIYYPDRPDGEPSNSQDKTSAVAAERLSWWRKMDELGKSRIAVCLVGGARRFELTGPSIVDMILREYPNSDLFLHSPLDNNSFKLSLLKNAPRIAAVRIFKQKPLPETVSQVRVLTAMNSPNGIQGLIQYFSLVEGCLTMIKAYQAKNGFTYDWIVRTRVDGYWNAPLHPSNFFPGQYLVPPGSSFGGLNDRLGIGDFKTSEVALSRISLIPGLDAAGLSGLNSESAFKAQLTTQGVPYITKRLPFCIVSDRVYGFPPGRFGVPVAAMSSRGPMSGAKCRPCTAVCQGQCVADVMTSLEKGWSWTHWGNGTLELCDAHSKWEKGWEKIFDGIAGERYGGVRKRISSMKLEECVRDFQEMKRRSKSWKAPPVEGMCKMGLALK